MHSTELEARERFGTNTARRCCLRYQNVTKGTSFFQFGSVYYRPSCMLWRILLALRGFLVSPELATDLSIEVYFDVARESQQRDSALFLRLALTW